MTALRDDQGAIVGYLLIGTDNSARKQVEAEQMKLDRRLRDQQFYTRSLIESNIDALMTTDPAGIITDVNKQMEALTGWTRDELIGAPFKNYFTDPGRAEAAIKLVLREKKLTNCELTACSRDGKTTVVSYNATTFYDRDRKLQGVFAAARDVTEPKRLDQALKEQNDELKRAVQHEPRILLDLQMPDMDGFQVMEGLKEIEQGGYLPVLVITAQPSHKLRALEAGAKDLVKKPFDLSELRARAQHSGSATTPSSPHFSSCLLVRAMDPGLGDR